MNRKIKTSLIITGIIFVVLVVASFSMAFIGAYFIGARDIVGEEAAITRLNQISKAENQCLKAFGEYGTEKQLIQNKLLEEILENDLVRKRYSYTFKITPKTENQSSAFHVNADPANNESFIFIPTWRHFYIGSDVNEIHVNNNHPATADDKILEEK